jgi:voltage-gated potassium channel
MSARVEDLKAIPLFARLEPGALEQVAEAANEVETPAGQLLAQPGATGSGMFFVLEGTLEVESREGTRELGPGDFFGELALLTDDGRRTARVQTKTEVRCLAFDRAAFEALIARHPEIAATMLETALTRLAEPDS